LRGIEDAIEGDAMFSGDRREDFEDVGGLFDDGVRGASSDEFVDLFAQLVLERSPVCARGQRRHAGRASGGSNDVRNIVPNEFAHAVPLPGNNAVVQFYPAGLTSRVRRGR
jgi:hypothetical protein